MSGRLAGRYALVTGAAHNIGAGIARRLVAEGARVALCDRDAAACAELARALGTATRAFPADLSLPDEVAAMLEAVQAWQGPVGLLVNNAGLTPVRHPSLLDLDVGTWDGYFAVNVRAAFLCAQWAARGMLAAGTGSIVNVSSIGARRAHADTIAYDATKGALEAMTRALAVQLAPHRIRVNAVAPALVATDRYTALPAAQRAARAAPVPLGRAATLDEIAAVVAFLASDEAAYVTGQVLAVDGGQSVQASPALPAVAPPPPGPLPPGSLPPDSLSLEPSPPSTPAAASPRQSTGEPA